MRRVRITLPVALVLVAVAALVANHFRPLSRSEAVPKALAYLSKRYPDIKWTASIATTFAPQMGRVWGVVAYPSKPLVEEGGFATTSHEFVCVLVHVDGRCLAVGVSGSPGGALGLSIDADGKVDEGDYCCGDLGADELFDREDEQ